MKHPVSTKTFPSTGTPFSGFYAAEKWLREHGYVVGSMQRDAPIGVHHGSECSAIAKWRNLSARDREQLHGVIEAGSKRDGDVTVTFREGQS